MDTTELPKRNRPTHSSEWGAGYTEQSRMANHDTNERTTTTHAASRSPHAVGMGPHAAGNMHGMHEDRSGPAPRVQELRELRGVRHMQREGALQQRVHQTMPRMWSELHGRQPTTRVRVPLDSIERELTTLVNPELRPNGAPRLDSTSLPTEDAHNSGARTAALALLASINRDAMTPPDTLQTMTGESQATRRPEEARKKGRLEPSRRKATEEKRAEVGEAQTGQGTQTTKSPRTQLPTIAEASEIDSANEQDYEDWKQVWGIIDGAETALSERAATALRNVVQTGKTPRGEAPRLLRAVTKIWDKMEPSAPYRRTMVDLLRMALAADTALLEEGMATCMDALTSGNENRPVTRRIRHTVNEL